MKLPWKQLGALLFMLAAAVSQLEFGTSTSPARPSTNTLRVMSPRRLHTGLVTSSRWFKVATNVAHLKARPYCSCLAFANQLVPTASKAPYSLQVANPVSFLADNVSMREFADWCARRQQSRLLADQLASLARQTARAVSWKQVANIEVTWEPLDVWAPHSLVGSSRVLWDAVEFVQSHGTIAEKFKTQLIPPPEQVSRVVPSRRRAAPASNYRRPCPRRARGGYRPWWR